MSDVVLDGIQFPPTANFIGTRDVARQIVKAVAVTFAADNVTVAVEENASRESPEDRLVIFNGTRTAVLALRYSPLLCWLGSQGVFIGGQDGAQRVADEIVTAVRNVLFRWES